jgi:hypothetical protein
MAARFDAAPEISPNRCKRYPKRGSIAVETQLPKNSSQGFHHNNCDKGAKNQTDHNSNAQG